MKNLPRVIIDLDKIVDNYQTLNQRCARAGIRLAGVLKGVAGDRRIIRALVEAGLDEIGDSRLENLRRMRRFSRTRKIMLRLPGLSRVADIIKYADLSLNSEFEVLNILDGQAKTEKVIHQVILMVDLGDLREGVSGEKLWELGRACQKLNHIKVVGLGANFSCFVGAIPTPAKLTKLAGLAKKLSGEFRLPVAYVSGGNSSSLPLLYKGTIPSGINHLRIGEGILLGRETLSGSFLPDLNHDAFIVEAEAVQVQWKPVKTDDEVGFDAFGRIPDIPVAKEGIRVLLNIGHQDTPLTGLTPLDPAYAVLGGSSDYLVLASEKKIKVGEIIRFRPNYWSVLGLMTSSYVGKIYMGKVAF